MASVIKKLGITEGAKELIALAQSEGLDISEWCDLHKSELKKEDVLRAVHGLTKRISVDLAVSIQKVTKGRIKASQWASETAE